MTVTILLSITLIFTGILTSFSWTKGDTEPRRELAEKAFFYWRR